MTIRHLLRDIIFWLSAFSIGSALFTAALCLRMVRANPRRYISYALAKIGYSTVVGIVLVRILLPIAEVPADAWAWGYTAGLALAGLGFMGVGRAVRQEFVEWELSQELPTQEETT